MAGVTYALSPRGVFSNSGTDYKLRAGSDALPEPALAAARLWNNALLQTDNPSLAVLARVEDDWWLIAAQRDRVVGRDTRPKSSLYLGRLDYRPAPGAALPLLRGLAAAVRQNQEVPATVQVERLEVPGACGGPALRACLAAVLGQNAALPDNWEAESVLSGKGGVGLAALRWVALVLKKLPDPPPPGPGLFLGPAELPPPAELVPLLDALAKGGDRPPLRLAELAAAPDAPGVKGAALLLALDPDAPPLGASPSLEALLWLARGGPAARREAFRLVGREQAPAWLARLEDASFDELAALRDRQLLDEGESSEQVLRLLESPTQLLDRPVFDGYHELFPDATEPRLDRLDPAAFAVWNALRGQGGEAPADRGQVTRLLRGAAGRRFAGRFSLAGLAWAARSGSEPATPLFREALVREGVPPGLAAAMTGESEERSGPWDRPTLEPAWGWLRAVDARAFLLRCRPAGETWWLAGVKALLEHRQLSRQELLTQGVTGRDPALLRAAGAGQALLCLAALSGRFRVPVPEDEWNDKADALLDDLYLKQELWARLEPPLTEDGMGWLVSRLRRADLKQAMQNRFGRLRDGGKVSDAGLVEMAALLRGMPVLKQLVRIVQSEGKYAVECRGVLHRLLHPASFPPEKRDWLRAWLLTCKPLPADPAWTAAELNVLLPALPNQGERAVRSAFHHDKADVTAEARLARSLKTYFQGGGWRPPPAPAARDRHPALYDALAEALGWPARPAPLTREAQHAD